MARKRRREGGVSRLVRNIAERRAFKKATRKLVKRSFVTKVSVGLQSKDIRSRQKFESKQAKEAQRLAKKKPKTSKQSFAERLIKNRIKRASR